jgi:hypothetical protein
MQPITHDVLYSLEMHDPNPGAAPFSTTQSKDLGKVQEEFHTEYLRRKALYEAKENPAPEAAPAPAVKVDGAAVAATIAATKPIVVSGTETGTGNVTGIDVEPAKE